MMLYEVASEYDDLANADEELPDDYLARFQGEVRSQVLTLARVLRRLEGEAGAIETELERLTARRANRLRRVTAIKEHMRRLLEDAGLEKVQDAMFTIALRLNPGHVEVVDQDAIPAKFQRAVLHVPLEALPAEMVPYTKALEVLRGEIAAHVKATGEIPSGVDFVRDTRVEVR